MPNHGKGGRKPERDQVKRSAVAVRTTPEIKARLVAAADEAGRSVTQEIEARLEASLAMDRPSRSAETLRLLSALAEDIERAEQLSGRQWHKHLPTWAMVRESLASGEIERQCPENDRLLTDTDGDAAELAEKRFKLFNQIHYDAITVRELGFHLTEVARTVDNLDAPLFDYEAEAERLKAADLPEAIKGVIKSHYLTRMSQQDDERGEAERAYWEAFRWMADAINDGVIMWEHDLRDRGIAQAREYRPSATLRAPVPALPAALIWPTIGDWMRGNPTKRANESTQIAERERS